MLVPGHLVSLYVATCGASGPNLGSDEKEIILLVYTIIDVQTSRIVGYKQYLVRPLGQLAKDHPPNTTTLLNNNAGENEECNDLTSHITETLLQKAGKPLNEVIDEFDTYTRSLSIDPNSSNFRLVTDGQLPLRQCLHPEACAKEIDLPSYYWRFCDLRKEFVRFKAGDLSKALVPASDASKLNSMPNLPTSPNSIAEMLGDLDLDINALQDADKEFYVAESRDMVTVIQSLLRAGHKFEANEVVNLTLEPGICSIDDEIDGTCIVRARGLPWQSSDQDIARFFRGLNVAKGGVALCLSPQGRRNGEALVRFVSQEHRDMALKRHKNHIGNRYIEVYRATGDDFLQVAGGASGEAQAFLSKGAQVIIRMRGLPYDCTAKQVLEFFDSGENACKVLDEADGVLFVKKPDGRATGDAFVLFSDESDASKALSKHRESIGQRYIELFRSTTAEVQQVLNRSLDPKTYEQHQPPLIAQLPPVQMSILPQHIITSGTEKSCIRLRGLPYEAKVEHILQFLDDFAKHIVYQGVHLVFNAQGQFNGEAFIQMDSEQAAFMCAQQKHHRYMMFGKKQRYIEVFQCSGDDMNMVLHGASFQPNPANLPKSPLLSPGGTVMPPPFGGYAPFPGPGSIPLNGMTGKPDPRCPTIINDPNHMVHLHPAFYPQPILYWGYPSPPVSPTTYYGPPPPTAHLPPPTVTQAHQPALLPANAPPATQLIPTQPQQQPPQTMVLDRSHQTNGLPPSSPTTVISTPQTPTTLTIPNGIIHSPTQNHHSTTTHHPIPYPSLHHSHHHHNHQQFIVDTSVVPTHDKMPRVITPIAPAQNQYVELFIV